MFITNCARNPTMCTLCLELRAIDTRLGILLKFDCRVAVYVHSYLIFLPLKVFPYCQLLGLHATRTSASRHLLQPGSCWLPTCIFNKKFQLEFNKRSSRKSTNELKCSITNEAWPEGFWVLGLVFKVRQFSYQKSLLRRSWRERASKGRRWTLAYGACCVIQAAQG